MMMTPEGAALLRRVRNDICAHPDEFDWGSWSQCIAGKLAHRVGLIVPEYLTPMDAEAIALRALGIYDQHVEQLFYIYWDGERDAAAAIRRIDHVLWTHGYLPVGALDMSAVS